MRREETHHGPASQRPTPATLRTARTATIQFDGLILGAYNQGKRLYQAGVHVEAEHHHLVITVTQNKKLVWPKNPSEWDSELGTVKTLAPFWLFVDSGDGLNPKAFDASLHKPHDTTDPLAFGKLFSFVRQHGRELPLNTAAFAVFNIPQGTAYSALNDNAKLKEFKKGDPDPASSATSLGEINVSTIGAIDIEDASDEKTKRELVLVGAGGKREFFRLPLVAGAPYEIKMDNGPILPIRPHHHDPVNPVKHFLQYYELFSPFNRGEKQFIVELPPHPVESEDSPPCVGSSGSTTGGLGGGG